MTMLTGSRSRISSPLAGWKSIDTQQEGFGYSHIRKYARGVSVTTMHQYDLAISPHAAALGKVERPPRMPS